MAKILVVEDEELILKALEFRLKKEGHQIVLERNGKEASDMIRQNAFDLIIMDMMLPFIGGIDLIKEIRQSELHSHTPILLIAAPGLDGMLMKVFELNVTDFIIKPFNLNELVLRVKKIMDFAVSV